MARSNEVELIGQSDAMGTLREDIECAARCDVKVLVTGETGVGKEVVARLIHHRSGRSSESLVTVNCAGLPDSLLESELFGHVRGSFTGAYRDKPGLLEMAAKGTVFLDEVGEMTTRMQVVLLRFLETGEVQRVGSNHAHARVNVRVITATNRDLQNEVTSGAFREDLYFRLNVIRLCIPPLRERREDIPLLVNRYLDVYSTQHKLARPTVTPAAMDALVAHRWPGNVRELKNVVERVTLRARGPAIHPTDLPQEFLPQASESAPAGSSPAERHSSLVEELSKRLFDLRESFWATAYPAFMSHDLTRDDLRQMVRRGLEETNGNYRLLVQFFNMPPEDYKRFLNFLRKHDCHLPFQRFRVVPARVSALSPEKAVGSGRLSRV
jgi:transcriptional regulator with GAF, ATPase, and Fis domain